MDRAQHTGMPGAGDLWQVGGPPLQGLLRQPGERDGFQIVAVHAEFVGRLYAATSQQGGEAVAQNHVMRAAATQIDLFRAAAVSLYRLRDA